MFVKCSFKNKRPWSEARVCFVWRMFHVNRFDLLTLWMQTQESCEKETQHNKNQNSRKMLEKMTYNREREKKTNIKKSNVTRKLKRKLTQFPPFLSLFLALALSPLSFIYDYTLLKKDYRDVFFSTFIHKIRCDSQFNQIEMKWWKICAVYCLSEHQCI